MRRDPPFIGELLQAITSRGMSLLGRTPLIEPARMAELAELLLSRRGEVSGIALARMLLDSYASAEPEARRAFLTELCHRWGPDRARTERAVEAFRTDPDPAALAALHEASEPLRQEILRRLNMAPGGTAALIAMRRDLIAMTAESPELELLDRDFVHLFSSWFNRGFLQLRSIEWTTPANILEKIIRYEAVHAISDWDDLRGRLEPGDRRCFAFFHPALPDEPLIFVEVALTAEISSHIDALLAADRAPLAVRDATTAIFYSISNCQPGLTGVSFGSLLIKQVAEDLKHELPRLRHFATLSPVLGFAAWLASERAAGTAPWMNEEIRAAFALLDAPDWAEDEAARTRLREPLLAAAAQYLLRGHTDHDHPLDPVARFHLGNGARLERLDMLADPSPRGLRHSHGMMVNYLYALDEIERNHEAYAQAGTRAASAGVRQKLPHTAAPLRETP